MSTEFLKTIGERLKIQDNRCTSNPMFCVQIKKRDVGYDADYASGRVWHNFAGDDENVYDDDPDFQEPEGENWGEFGYVDRWETVMFSFTEYGCQEYLELDGHNVKRRAFRGEVRIFVESFNRCPEMIGIREALLSTTEPKTGPRTLDAKWLDPECWDGCQSLLFKAKIERYENALRRILNYPVHSEPVGGALEMKDIAHKALMGILFPGDRTGICGNE